MYLVILQQNEAEIELREGQLQVLYVSVFASLLLWQGEHRLPPPQPSGIGQALPLGVQRRLQLILEGGEPPLRFSQLFWRGLGKRCTA